MLSPYCSMTSGNKCLKAFAHNRHDNPGCKVLGASAELNVLDEWRGVGSGYRPMEYDNFRKSKKRACESKEKGDIGKVEILSNTTCSYAHLGYFWKTYRFMMIFAYIQGS